MPHVYTWNVGDSHTIAAVSLVSCAGCQYEWTSWSDGVAQSHSITVPSSATTYTATFTEWSISFSYTLRGTPPGLSIRRNGTGLRTVVKLRSNVWALELCTVGIRESTVNRVVVEESQSGECEGASKPGSFLTGWHHTLRGDRSRSLTARGAGLGFSEPVPEVRRVVIDDSGRKRE